MASPRISLFAALFAAACGSAHPGGDFYTASESGLSICAAGPVVEGIDVSKYEGSIDWAAVKGAGIGFGIARVSDGLNYPDATFDANWAAMKSQGLVRAAYQFFEPAQDPIAQANMVIQKVGTLGAGDLPAVIDVEKMGGVSAAAVVAGVNKWLAAVQSGTGRRPIVYASPSFWDGLGDPTVDADLWIANWQVSCPSVPAAWSGWKFWQYTATGTVSGVPVTAMDRDRFNGSMADLTAYAGGGSAPPPPCSAGTVPVGGACVPPPPPPTGCNSSSGGASGILAALIAALALLKSRSWRAPT